MSARALREELEVGDRRVRLEARLEGAELLARLTEDGAERGHRVPVAGGAAGGVWLTVGGRRLRAVVRRVGGRWLVAVGGEVYEVLPEAVRAGRAHHGGTEPFATSPMTGLLAQVAVAPGERVPAGATLLVVEAMKMEYPVKAPRAVVVRSVEVRPGEAVAAGQVLVRFEEEAP